MLRLCLSHPPPCWNLTDMCVRSATKGSRGTRIFKCTGEGTRCHGNCLRGRHKGRRRESLCVQSQAVCTMTLAMPLGILWASRSTSEGSTAITSSGSVTSAPKGMPFNLITRHTSKPVALGAIPVTVAVSFPGLFAFCFPPWFHLSGRVYSFKFQPFSLFLGFCVFGSSDSAPAQQFVLLSVTENQTTIIINYYYFLLKLLYDYGQTLNSRYKDGAEKQKF